MATRPSGVSRWWSGQCSGGDAGGPPDRRHHEAASRQRGDPAQRDREVLGRHVVVDDAREYLDRRRELVDDDELPRTAVTRRRVATALGNEVELVDRPSAEAIRVELVGSVPPCRIVVRAV